MDQISSEPDAHSDQPAKPSRKRVVYIGLTLVAALVAGGVYWQYFRAKTKSPAASQQTPTPSASVVPADEAALLLKRFGQPTTGETWLAAPKKLPAQGFFREGDADATYYQVGQRGNAQILMTVVSQIGDFITLYERTPDGKVVAVTHPDGEAIYNAELDKNYDGLYRSKVTLNNTIHYDSLTMPPQVVLDKHYSVKKPSTPWLGNFIVEKPSGDDTTVKQIGSNRIVRSEKKYLDTKLTTISYVLITPINTRVALSFLPLELDLDGYQWQRGATPSDTISPLTRGCGSLTASVTRADALLAADLRTVGRSSSGLQVYELVSINHPLMAKAYQEFIDFYQESDRSSTPYFGISKDKFAHEHGVVVMRDKYDQWLVYARDQLRPQGGCAKPVIYLYPQQAQQVSVRVGANVKVSLPAYNPTKGWTVWATPSGKLNVGGTSYDSLFWEGPGNGSYPGITSGTVVARHQVVAVMRRQLAEQGLVGREIEDFMTYWEPRLPNKPFVRLTWLTTAQMNELAPLSISPRPTTLVRVFLDFDGLDQPIDLPAQSLKSIPRDGFTVVEWGGLANFKLK